MPVTFQDQILHVGDEATLRVRVRPSGKAALDLADVSDVKLLLLRPDDTVITYSLAGTLIQNSGSFSVLEKHPFITIEHTGFYLTQVMASTDLNAAGVYYLQSKLILTGDVIYSTRTAFRVAAIMAV